MLKVVCPLCQYEMKLGKPKQGKFTPTCKECGSKFQLLIKQLEDKTFKYKAAPLNKPKSAPTVDEETRIDPGPKKPAQAKPSAPAATKAQPTQGITNAASGTVQGKDQTAAAVGRTRRPGAPARAGRLGPYRLIKMLGEGGMGSVYLANQTTLDRNVALKVVRSKFSGNAKMLARFTREAYAAAQLVHPNVVQIYDMGNDNGNSFFSMELVDGSSLSELVGEKKHLDSEEATSYILHAARGLQCAHNAGMVHRDIKPANLLVNKEGLVKVADLGLVKVPERDFEEDEAEVNELIAASASKDITRVGSTIGTPYYMAPEQAKSSAVDHRADIYSLGCTFYVLLTGKKPFDGKSVEEVRSKHSSEPLVLPSKIIERVPEELSAIVSRMMAKKPEDRYQSAGELIEDLEAHLGIKSASVFTPDEKDANAIDAACKAFNKPALAKLRGVVPMALIAGSLLLAVVTFFVSWKLATGFLLLPLFAFATSFLLGGLGGGSVLFNKVRELFFKGGVFSWIKWSLAVLLLVVASFLVGTFGHWALLGIVGAGLGAGIHFLVDVPLRRSRREPIAQAEKLVRRMRVKGMDESTIQTFVAKYSPAHWEEFFESLFDYEAKRRVRDEISQSDIGKKKAKFRAWRDGFHDRLASRLDTFSNAEDRKHLQQVEQAGLVAGGLTIAEAKAQAQQMADAMVDHGDSIRVAQLEKRLREVDPQFQREERRKKIKAMLAKARSGKYKKEETTLERISPVLDRFFGSYPRFLIGCCLVLGSLYWARSNDLLMSVDQLKELGQQGASALQETVTTGESGEATAAATESAKVAGQELLDAGNKPTNSFLGIFYDFNSLIAGLILLLSTIVFGWRMSIFIVPAVIIAMFGHAMGIPDMIPFQVPHLNKLTAVIGIGLFMMGIVFGRRED